MQQKGVFKVERKGNEKDTDKPENKLAGNFQT